MIPVYCTGTNRRPHEPKPLTHIYDGRFLQSKSAQFTEWGALSVRCRYCAHDIYMGAENHPQIARFIEDHPELLTPDGISGQMLQGLVRRTKKVRAAHGL